MPYENWNLRGGSQIAAMSFYDDIIFPEEISFRSDGPPMFVKACGTVPVGGLVRDRRFQKMQRLKNLELTEDEINRRLVSYESQDTTKELYKFGMMLLTEVQRRTDNLDAKATKIAGYSGAALALFVSTLNIWSRNLSSAQAALLTAGMSCVFAAGLLALLVWSIAKFSWFSENEWFKEECLNDADRLQRYHVLTMHGVFQSHKRICAWKARLLRWTGYFLAVAYLLLIVILYLGA